MDSLINFVISMYPLIFLMILILFIVYTIYFYKQKKRAVILCNNEIKNQSQKLYIKREQLIYYDDYGTLVENKWLKEIDHFINSRIKPLLTDHKLILYYSFIEYYIKEQIIITASSSQILPATMIDQLSIGSEIYHPDMNPLDYELLCAKKLREIGWEATVTKASGDQGADVIARKNGITLILQCKLYSKPVSNRAIQEVNTARIFYHADYSAVISNAPFTVAARQIAASTNTKLLHYDELQTYALSLS